MLPDGLAFCGHSIMSVIIREGIKNIPNYPLVIHVNNIYLKLLGVFAAWFSTFDLPALF